MSCKFVEIGVIVLVLVLFLSVVKSVYGQFGIDKSSIDAQLEKAKKLVEEIKPMGQISQGNITFDELGTQSAGLSHRWTSVLNACVDKIASGDNTLLLPCKEVISNLNNHLRQALNESENQINTILYKQ